MARAATRPGAHVAVRMTVAPGAKAASASPSFREPTGEQPAPTPMVNTQPPVAAIDKPRAGTKVGRLAILAYHSLEDHRVKTAFRRWAANCICPTLVVQCVCGWRAKVRLVTSRPLRPEGDEIARNPRARSARLRIVERITEEA